MQVADRALTIGTATRPYPGQTANGDAWHVSWRAGVCRLALIDGVGHGPAAAAAAQTATAILAAHPDLGPVAALQVCHRALAASCGAVAAIARIAPDTGVLTYAGIGNIEARLWQSGQEQRPISYRGILGVALPIVRGFDFTLSADWCLVLHTDGISSQADFAALRVFAERNMAALAETILARWGRMTDDATVVAVCPAASYPSLLQSP